MYTKFIALVTGLVVAVAGLASTATATSGSACPEARSACQPVGERPGSQKPRAKASGVRLTPRVDSGGQLWRAGNHIMQ